ncbi:MAG: hypothetical protein K9G49_08715 [Taibaiella sp.]|nr:hypothetical protein [Taibaiella sp.]
MVLTLSVQPVCADVSSSNACCSSVACNEDAGQQESTGSHDDECNSVCNPFHECGCCAFCIVIPHQLSFVPTYVAPVILVNWGVLSEDVADEPVSGFWQPPRVA